VLALCGIDFLSRHEVTKVTLDSLGDLVSHGCPSKGLCKCALQMRSAAPVLFLSPRQRDFKTGASAMRHRFSLPPRSSRSRRSWLNESISDARGPSQDPPHFVCLPGAARWPLFSPPACRQPRGSLPEWGRPFFLLGWPALEPQSMGPHMQKRRQSMRTAVAACARAV
jgi:hypothetical protein